MDSPASATDKKTLVAQQLRLRRSLMASGAILANHLVILVAWYLGYVLLSFNWLFIYFCIATAGSACFPWLIYQNKNLNFKDPSLTSWQISWQLMVLSFGMFIAPGIRELLIISYVLVLIFGVFKYHPKQLPLLAGFSLAMYALVVLAQLTLSSVPVHWPYEIITGLVLVLAVIFVSFLGIEIASLRLALKRRNEHLAFLTEKNQQLAITDDLTGLFNRRHLMSILSRQRNLASRGNYKFSLIFIDLDHFKQVNDTFGHAAGDLALQAVAQRLEKSLREVDYVARIGGEEFVAVLVHTEYQPALRTAERLRSDIAELVISLDNNTNFSITASFGVASFQDNESVNSLVQRADNAVYSAKNSGRNCIVGEDELPKSKNSSLVAMSESTSFKAEQTFPGPFAAKL